jgi:asparagine N-glycosylation enzyme membrane subunit Stt3
MCPTCQPSGTLRERFSTRRRDDAGNLAKGITMLWTIAVVLMLLWLLGMVSSYTLGGFIHILLVLAVVTVLIRLITGRKIVQ